MILLISCCSQWHPGINSRIEMALSIGYIRLQTPPRKARTNVLCVISIEYWQLSMISMALFFYPQHSLNCFSRDCGISSGNGMTLICLRVYWNPAITGKKYSLTWPPLPCLVVLWQQIQASLRLPDRSKYSVTLLRRHMGPSPIYT